MREGTVDENWAAAHHSLWLEDVKNGTATDPAHRRHPDTAPDSAPGRPAPRPGPAH
jgi:formate dehydrogenase subunit gamma